MWKRERNKKTKSNRRYFKKIQTRETREKKKEEWKKGD